MARISTTSSAASGCVDAGAGLGTFLQLSFALGALAPEAAEEACFEAGALSVTFTDARDDPVLEPLPGEFRLWPVTRVQALFDAESTPGPELAATLRSGLGLPAAAIAIETVADRAWEREWLRDWHALRFGERLWICPRHESVPEAAGVVVRLDPGLAFGTGTHPSTALCLEWLDRRLLPGVELIDYGCGSGILAIAALRLGAARAQCHDIDGQALLATAENAAENGVQERTVLCSSPGQLTPADVLLANILSGPLCVLAPRFAGLVRPGGQVVLAGLMEHETADVTRAYRACFDMRPFGHRDGWVCLEGRRLTTSAPAV